MSRINKEFWKWDESLNNTHYKLGDDISELLDLKEIDFDKEKDEYNVLLDNEINSLKTKGNKIDRVYFSRNIKNFINVGLWELEYSNFKIEMDNILESTNKDYKGDKILVVFRDYFVDFVMLIKGEIR